MEVVLILDQVQLELILDRLILQVLVLREVHNQLLEEVIWLPVLHLVTRSKRQ